MPLPVGQVRMRMVGAEFGTDLRGPTVCEVIDEPEVADVVAKLGPDPLRRDADGSLAWTRIAKSRRPIGALLMDQTVIAGIGNVYRNELLFRHRIDPYRPGHRRPLVRARASPHLRLPPRRRSLSGVRDDAAYRGARRAQCLLVPELPALNVDSASTAQNCE